MKPILTLALSALALWPSPGRQDYASIRARAEQLYAQGSYELAHREYEQAARLELDAEARRWVDFRLADTSWRSAAATDAPDETAFDRAKTKLLELAPDERQPWERDRVWSEARESLGDFYWNNPHRQSWGEAWPHYSAALEWWASSSELELARQRFLAIVWRTSAPDWYRDQWVYGNYVGNLEPKVLEDALKIARTPEELSHAHYLLALRYAQQGQDPRTAPRAVVGFEKVLAIGRQGEWYDDALFQYGRFLEETGRAKQSPNGGWTWENDFVGAVSIYKRLAREFAEGESRWRDDALNRIQNITQASVNVSVDRFFLPDSEIQYRLSWRNAKSLDLALYAIDLTGELRFTNDGPGNWLEAIPLDTYEARRRWTHDTEDTGEHRHGQALTSLEEKLPLGAYVLEARADGQRSRALVLVSDVALTAKATGTQLLAWFTDVRTGAPLAGAKLRLWESYDGNNERRWRRLEGESAADGTALFRLHERARNTNGFLAASLGERQAFAMVGSWYVPSAETEWRIYAYTDRSTYRPGDAVAWKLVARTREQGRYATPAGTKLRWEIHDPRGGTLAEGDSELDAFGSAWGTVETTAEAALGEYSVQFYRTRGNSRDFVGQAMLFRLEEYKAPEFEVTVSVPEDEQGRPRLYRVGDQVAFDVEATYYYGAPVANAEVEVIVYQKPFWHRWPKPREFPWLYADSAPVMWWGGPGQQVLHQKLKTDLAGKAQVTLDTAFDASQDYEYTIEARVIDSSRREIVGTRSLKVTRQQFFAQVDAKHALHRPGAPIDVEVETKDANGNPVAAAGRIEATRERWVEIWVDPSGREVRQPEIERLRHEHGTFPPPSQIPWQQRFGGYEREVVAGGELATSAAGLAAWRFTPDREGTYRIVWRSFDDRGVNVEATTTAFVASEETRELGYLPGGIEILADRDTFEIGETAPILLAAPASGRWVLFTVEAEELLHYEVVQLVGTVKLLQLPIQEQHVPNIFLTATMIADGEGYSDLEEVVVPPARQFLDVQLTPDRDTLRPGDESTWSVLVRDRDQRPVSVDIGLSIVDDSLAYIQGDYAGDPRQFFYGERRGDQVNTTSTFHQGTFARYRRDEQGEVWDEEERGADYGAKDERYRYVQDYDADSFLGERLGLAGAGPSSPAPAQEAMSKLGYADDAKRGQGGFRGPSDTVPPTATVRVRSDFRDTALWLPSLRTDAEGKASISLPLPDQTTRWRATARAADTGARFGIGEATARTRQPLIVRLQAPRFFQTGDEVVVSGNFNNDTDGPLEVSALFEAQGLAVLGLVEDARLRPVAPDEQLRVSIPAKGEVRLDWRVRVDAPGEALLRLTAAGADVGDGMERRYPIHEHGIEAFVARAGKFRGSGLEFALDVPAARKRDSTELRIQVTPSIAVTMLDALPYLVGYPYGCTEQTLSRFLPCAIVAKTLKERGLSAEDALQRVFGGIEQEHAQATHPNGRKALDRLDEMVKQGLERLYDFQHDDGGWGWWKTDESDRYMTAYVVWGLSLARGAGIEVRAGVLEKAARWLGNQLVEAETEPHLQAWMLHALATFGGDTGEPRSKELFEKAYANVMRTGKDRLNAYSRALMALVAHRTGHADDARLLLENLYNGVQVDETPDRSVVQQTGGESQPYVLKTAHWGSDRVWRSWYEGGIEATAFALAALVEIDPDHALVEPVVNWLVKNRRAAQWSNTRDTAIAVLALNGFLERGGELDSDVEFAVSLNGRELGTRKLTKAELLRAPSEFIVAPELVQDGENRVHIERRSGDGPLYFAAYASFFSLEEPIPPRGNEVFVHREYFKLVGRRTLLRGFVHDRVPLRDGETVKSGERVEVVITAEAKNDLEYMVFEDLKPAGFEAVRVRSGEPLWARELRADEVAARFDPALAEAERERRRTGNARQAPDPVFENQNGGTGRTRPAHQELRDRKVALFLDRVPEGVWEMRYDLRAEVPGSFHALPLMAHAMYVPEIRANGDELRVTVLDAPSTADESGN